MATTNPEVHAISKIARVLEELPAEDRSAVIGFLSASHPGSERLIARAKAPARVEGMLEDLDFAARRRVLKLFADQLGPDPVE